MWKKGEKSLFLINCDVVSLKLGNFLFVCWLIKTSSVNGKQKLSSEQKRAQDETKNAHPSKLCHERTTFIKSTVRKMIYFYDRAKNENGKDKESDVESWKIVKEWERERYEECDTRDFVFWGNIFLHLIKSFQFRRIMQFVHSIQATDVCSKDALLDFQFQFTTNIVCCLFCCLLLSTIRVLCASSFFFVSTVSKSFFILCVCVFFFSVLSLFHFNFAWPQNSYFTTRRQYTELITPFLPHSLACAFLRYLLNSTVAIFAPTDGRKKSCCWRRNNRIRHLNWHCSQAIFSASR